MKRVLRTASGDKDTLLAFLAERLQLDESKTAQLLARGAVEVDGHRVLVDQSLRLGAKVIAFLVEKTANESPLSIAYKDGQVIVIDKPAGLRSQEVRGDTFDTLIAQVQRDIDPSVRLLHRLDRDASGLVLFPRGENARRSLQTALTEGTISRRYIARVKGRIEAAQSIALPIARDPHDPRRSVISATGDAALSHVEPIEPGDDESVVRLILGTGRTHQLRVHLAAIGHAILGDALYGEASGRLCLHAYEITFPHPRSDTPRTVRAPIPREITTVDIPL